MKEAIKELEEKRKICVGKLIHALDVLDGLCEEKGKRDLVIKNLISEVIEILEGLHA